MGLGGEGALRLGFRLGEGDGAVSRDAELNLVAAREIQEIADFLRNSDLTLDSNLKVLQQAHVRLISAE